MRDSSVVYVNEALYYYFSFMFYYLPFYGFKVGTFDIASAQQISITI